ncbi:L-galactose dehydrogenase [Morella rubra]|uniref:L-galactose dehydrogenase n=1 Tax=Morella rubra TaxID=262757 RepID=A0A6A1VN29_9ROSI|nr:L-galactose dehydrogenase [Morella rubra]
MVLSVKPSGLPSTSLTPLRTYYGRTLSEKVLGKALKALGAPRQDYIVSTKCGRYIEGFDFSAERVTRSIVESLARLQLDYVDILQCHDIEFGSLDQVVNETIPALQKLKEAGKIRFIGVTGLPLEVFTYVLDRVKGEYRNGWNRNGPFRFRSGERFGHQNSTDGSYLRERERDREFGREAGRDGGRWGAIAGGLELSLELGETVRFCFESARSFTKKPSAFVSYSDSGTRKSRNRYRNTSIETGTGNFGFHRNKFSPLDRVPPGTVDIILSYCHYSINDSTLEDLLPYLKSKGVGIITASPFAMGLLTKSGPPRLAPSFT